MGLVHLHFIETWGGGQAKHRKGQAGILCGFALPFENVGHRICQKFLTPLEGVRLCHNVMLCHEQLKDCYEVSRTFHKS